VNDGIEEYQAELTKSNDLLSGLERLVHSDGRIKAKYRECKLETGLISMSWNMEQLIISELHDCCQKIEF